MNVNWSVIGCAGVFSSALNYVAYNTPYLSVRSWKAQRKLSGLLHEFSKENHLKNYRQELFENFIQAILLYKRKYPDPRLLNDREFLKQTVLTWKNGIINAAFEAFKTECERINSRNKLPPLYCGFSIVAGLSLGASITKIFITQHDDKTKKRMATILSIVLTALFTLTSTKSTKLTLINSTICALSRFYYPL